jgi:uncharacterized protein YuzE
LDFKYDREADALYIRLTDGLQARTVQIEPGTLVDVDSAGTAVGIEVIRPGRPLPVDLLIRRFTLPTDAEVVLRLIWNQPDHNRFPFFHSTDLQTTATIDAG